MSQSDFRDWQQARTSRFQAALDQALPSADTYPARLHAAMRYACEGGKRLRALLVYGSGEALGLPPDRLDSSALAVELIHAYSLVHDDLPAMDDDALRRGQPTCHIRFGEATAILAGDALQALAFEVLTSDAALAAHPARGLRMARLLAEACGSIGMAGGQAFDLDAVGQSLSPTELERMHVHKTGALIRAAVVLGALGAGCEDEDQLRALARYGHCVGLAFQIRDDILDIEGDTAVIGKTQGADLARDKPTYPAILGLDESRRLARTLRDEALRLVAPLGARAIDLEDLAHYAIDRNS